MAEDIAPVLRKNVEQSYRNSVANDSELARIQKKIDEGTATGKDLDAFAVRSGELLAQALHEHVSGDILPNGRMYYNIANRLLPPVLRQNYEDVADVSDAIQTIMNEQAGIGIKAQRPELNEDRVEGLVDLAAEAEQYEDIRKELEGDVVNFSQSVATDSVKSNAEFQYQSGLSPKVERTAEASCCDWCKNLEGTYDYADIRGTGNEVWKRHRACRCVVEYVAAGKRQNAHTKQVSTMDREASAERIQRAQEVEKQDREQEQAEREERIRRAEELDNETLARHDGWNAEDIANFRRNAIMNLEEMRVNTGGKRNEIPLTEEQKIEAEAAAREQGFTGEIMQSDNSFTAFHGSVEGERFFYLVIGTDAYPSELAGETPNERISMRACMAHEVVGHYRAWERGTTNPIRQLEEAQASIRASRFGVGLSDEEREILFLDAMERLKVAGVSYDDVKDQLDIKEV